MNDRAVPAFTFGSVFTDWVLSPVGLGLGLALSLGYAGCLAVLVRRGQGVPVGRAVTFYLLGVGSLVLACDGGLAAHRGTSFIAAAAQSGVLAAITPVGIALGDPTRLARQVRGARRRRSGGTALRVGRILAFPLVASVLAVAVHLLFFVTPWLAASVEHGWVRELTYVALLSTGLLFVVPLISETDLLPTWCTDPIRVLIALADGLIDAVPGLVVMAWPRILGAPIAAYAAHADPLWQQHFGGGAMLAIAEAVELPFLVTICLGWVRSDERAAREADAALDRAREDRELAGPAPLLQGEDDPGDVRDRPWWETDPRFAGRYGPEPPTG